MKCKPFFFNQYTFFCMEISQISSTYKTFLNIKIDGKNNYNAKSNFCEVLDIMLRKSLQLIVIVLSCIA